MTLAHRLQLFLCSLRLFKKNYIINLKIYILKYSKMSILTEVLKTASEMDVIDINKSYIRISEKLDKFKVDVNDYMQCIYVDFLPIPSKCVALLNQSKRMQSDMKSTLDKINDLTKSEVSECTNEIKAVEIKLQEINYSLHMLNELLKIHEHFIKFNNHMKYLEYKEAAVVLTQLQECIEHPCNDIEYLNIFTQIRNKVDFSYNMLLIPIKETWQNCLKISDGNENDKTDATIEILAARNDDIEKTLEVLSLLYRDKIIPEIEEFSAYLLKQHLDKILKYQCTVETIDTDNSVILKLHIDHMQKPQCDIVFANIKHLFEFLENNINFQITNKSTVLLDLVGKDIGKIFSEKFINECLIDTIPSTVVEMEAYNSYSVRINELRAFLIDKKFLNENEELISHFCNNIQKMFIEKLCKSYVEKAQKIMKKDLHNTVEVGTDQYLVDETTESFPKCQISRSTLEFTDLIDECLTCSENSKVHSRMLETVHNLFQMYAVSMPQYHKKFLESLPQQVALFHNNCLYLADITISLNNKYKILEDLFLVLRKTGTETFAEHIVVQQKQILNIIKESGLADLGQTSHIDPNTEKYIRQCLRQFELLQNVWKKVLTVKIYDRAMGSLIDTFVEKLISCVTNVEDISVDVARQLVSMYSLVKQRAPKVFTEPNEVHRNVKTWLKLSELIYVLEASLIEIEERWADGKGPLAIEFQPEELKKLVRALFQNTDRRSAVLNKIK